MNWRSAVLVALACSVAVLASHATVLNTPYFWDEVGQFIPAARDFHERGLLAPRSATPNIHPPLVYIWVALAWKAMGASIAATRIAMLVLASLALGAVYSLAKPLAGREAAIWTALFLALSPLFYAQSMLAQLDLPAMLWTCLTILCFLRSWHAAGALCALLLVGTKETGAILPFWCLLWLSWQRKWRAAMLYALPLIALAGWLLWLRSATGHWAGNAEFASYNLTYPLHPVRLALALLRRGWFLFIDNAHWAGVIPMLVAWKARVYYGERWRFVAGFAFADDEPVGDEPDECPEEESKDDGGVHGKRLGAYARGPTVDEFEFVVIEENDADLAETGFVDGRAGGREGHRFR